MSTLTFIHYFAFPHHSFNYLRTHSFIHWNYPLAPSPIHSLLSSIFRNQYTQPITSSLGRLFIKAYFQWITCSLIHSFIHSFIYLDTHSYNYLFIYLFIHIVFWFIRQTLYTLIDLFIHSFTLSFAEELITSFIHSLTLSSSFVYWFQWIHQFNQSNSNLIIRLFIDAVLYFVTQPLLHSPKHIQQLIHFPSHPNLVTHSLDPSFIPSYSHSHARSCNDSSTHSYHNSLIHIIMSSLTQPIYSNKCAVTFLLSHSLNSFNLWFILRNHSGVTSRSVLRLDISGQMTSTVASDRPELYNWI